MSYMVIFRTPEGKPGYQQAAEVNEVVETVERLRNEDGVENVRIYRMDEVAFEYKVRYTVELTDPAAAGEELSAPADDVAPDAASTEALSWDDDEDADASGDTPQPFDQMAVDHTEAPRWGEGSGEQPVAVGDESDESGARRGLFGR